MVAAAASAAQYTAAIWGLPGTLADTVPRLALRSRLPGPPGFDLLALLLLGLEGRLPGAEPCHGLEGRLPLVLPAVPLRFFRGLPDRLVAAAAANSLLLDCLLPLWLLRPPLLLLPPPLLVMLRPNAVLPGVGEGGAAVVLIVAAILWGAFGLDGTAWLPLVDGSAAAAVVALAASLALAALVWLSLMLQRMLEPKATEESRCVLCLGPTLGVLVANFGERGLLQASSAAAEACVRCCLVVPGECLAAAGEAAGCGCRGLRAPVASVYRLSASSVLLLLMSTVSSLYAPDGAAAAVVTAAAACALACPWLLELAPPLLSSSRASLPADLAVS